MQKQVTKKKKKQSFGYVSDRDHLLYTAGKRFQAILKELSKCDDSYSSNGKYQ